MSLSCRVVGHHPATMDPIHDGSGNGLSSTQRARVFWGNATTRRPSVSSPSRATRLFSKRGFRCLHAMRSRPGNSTKAELTKLRFHHLADSIGVGEHGLMRLMKRGLKRRGGREPSSFNVSRRSERKKTKRAEFGDGLLGARLWKML
jgi:hypothetical protein